MNHSFQMAPSKLKSILWIMSYCSWKLGQYFSNSVQQKLALLMCQQKYDISIRLPPYDTLFTSKCTCESGASLCIHLRAVEAIPDDRDVIFSEGNLAESEKLGRAERIINLCCCCCYSCYSTPQHQCLHHQLNDDDFNYDSEDFNDTKIFIKVITFLMLMTISMMLAMTFLTLMMMIILTMKLINC